jgi:hypothetical protein
MSEGFTIANFRHVAKGLQPGQFAVGERKKAVGLSDLDPIYKQLLDQPVTMTLGLIGPDGRVTSGGFSFCPALIRHAPY